MCRFTIKKIVGNYSKLNKGKIVEKVFTIKNIDLLSIIRWGTDEFYKYLDEVYSKLFNIKIEILDIDVSCIDNGLLIKIKEYRNANNI